MSYHHLTTCDRGRIEALHKEGYSARRIGAAMGRHHSSISREMIKNNGFVYVAENAQHAYEERRKRSKSAGKFTSELAQTIEAKLADTWSPEQISSTVLMGILSFKTIYQWFYQGRLNRGDLNALRQKGKRRKPVETRGKFAVGQSIADRPEEVKSRETFGHWELDTVAWLWGQ